MLTVTTDIQSTAVTEWTDLSAPGEEFEGVSRVDSHPAFIMSSVKCSNNSENTYLLVVKKLGKKERSLK